MRTLLAVLVVLATAREAAAEAGCVTSAAKLTTKQGQPRQNECTATNLTCRDRCRAGDVAACVSRAVAIEPLPTLGEEARALFGRACELGAAIGCTNYAASRWANDDSDEGQACALRLFEKSCAAGEPFACGMQGRMILDAAKDAAALRRGQTHLEKSCAKLKGFPCRALALHLEKGKLGPVDKGRIRALLKAACEGGDPDGCDEPATAAETFH